MARQENNQIINLEAEFPEKEELPPPIRRLIIAFENLLGIRYPTRPERHALEARRRPMLTEISTVLIGYHMCTSPRAIAEDDTISRWLRLNPENIPNLQTVLIKLQQPHIQSCLASNGLATVCLPNLLLNTVNPPIRHANLLTPVTNFIIDGDEKTVYVFRARDIVQAQLAVFTYTNLYSPFTSYHLRFSLGREGSLLQLESAAAPFTEPTNLVVLYYNARGAGLHSFRLHLQDLIEEHQPMIVLITETRLGTGEAYQIASGMQYDQVMTKDGIGLCGGIWIFSNLTNLCLDQLLNNRSDFIFNFLKV